MVFHILKSLEDTAPTTANRVTLLHIGWQEVSATRLAQDIFQSCYKYLSIFFHVFVKVFKVFIEISAFRVTLFPTGWQGEVSATPIYPAAAPPARPQ